MLIKNLKYKPNATIKQKIKVVDKIIKIATFIK